MIRKVLIITAGLLASSAQGAEPGIAIGELGVNFQTGKTGKSLTGSLGYYGSLQAEKKKGILRPNVALELQGASGKLDLDTGSTPYTMYGAAFVGGFHLFFFPVGRVTPFVGGGGVLAWELLKLASPPSGVESNTQSLTYGYEADVGVDIRRRNDGRSFRIRSGLWSTSASLAGVSGFQLHGIRFSFGLSW
jgi:hypothetical protein